MDKLYKYPKIYHLKFSPGIGKYDRVMSKKDFEKLVENNDIVVTIKMDGENTTIYRDYVHPRSTTYSPHLSRNWLKAFSPTLDIPEDYRVCGENVYAKHSIHYRHLESHFLAHSVWNYEECLSWGETVDFCKRRGISMVPFLYIGKFDYYKVMNLFENYCKNSNDEVEGFVVRNVNSFQYKDFKNNIFKYVRKDHVKTDEHWFNKPVIRNFISIHNRN